MATEAEIDAAVGELREAISRLATARLDVLQANQRRDDALRALASAQGEIGKAQADVQQAQVALKALL